VSKNKKQHYISAFYLYNFTNSLQRNSVRNKRKVNIWHYDIAKVCVKEKAIENVATSSYHFSFAKPDGEYDHGLDDKLKLVEGAAAAAFNSLIDIVISLKGNGSQAMTMDNNIINGIIDFIVWQMRRHPEVVSDLLKQCEGNEFNLDPKEMALTVVEGFGRDKYADFESVLHEKNKTIIFTTNEKANFVTTDMPLVRFNKSETDGIGLESTEIYFPISSKVLLYLHGKGSRRELRIENDKAFLREANKYIASKARNYVFGSSKEQVESIVKYIR
jgi:hypothetical protein